MFTYSDELQNYRAVLNILIFHHDFHTNYSLPVSSGYPGLGNVTAAIVQTSGLSPFVAGTLVATFVHVFLASALLLLYRSLRCPERVAAAAALIYALGTEQDLMRMFVYEMLALPFLVLALYFTTLSIRARHWIPLIGLALSAQAIVTLTHHVTAATGVVLPILLAAGLALIGRTDASRRVLLIATAALIELALWIILVARTTVSYLGQPLISAVRSAFAGLGSDTPVAPVAHLGIIETALQLSGPAITVLAIPAVVVYLTRSQLPRFSLVSRMWATGGVLFFASVLTRLATSDGAELAGRMLAYTSIFTSFTLAVLVEILLRRSDPSVRGAHSKRTSTRDRFFLVSAVMTILILFVSGILSGLPPYYERIPGTFHVDAFESGVDPENIAAAQWSRSLGPGNLTFGDFTAYTLFGTLGDQDPVHGNVQLDRAFEESANTLSALKAFRYFDVRYVVTDSRDTTQTPITGSYFPSSDNYRGEPRTRPLSRRSITKFATAVGVSRVYDNGYIAVYDLKGSLYDP